MICVRTSETLLAGLAHLMLREHLLGWFVSQAAVRSLTASKNVSNETFSAECSIRQLRARSEGFALGPTDGCFQQWPTTAHPVAVTSINNLVRATCESSLGCILSCREPSHQCIHLDILFKRLLWWTQNAECGQRTKCIRGMRFIVWTGRDSTLIALTSRKVFSKAMSKVREADSTCRRIFGKCPWQIEQSDSN